MPCIGLYAKSLKYLTLRRAEITPSATNSMFQSLANIQLLELLDLGDVAIPASGFEWIAHQPNLNRLKLNGAQPQNRDLSQLARLSKLQYLDLSNSVFQENAAEAIGQLQGLLDLDLSGSTINDAGLNAVSRLSHLELLTFRTPAIHERRLSPTRKELRIIGAGIGIDSD